MNPEINQVLSLIVNALVVGGVILGIRILWNINKKTDQLWEIHLGPKAFDEHGIPRWYTDSAITEALQELSRVITDNTDVMTALLTEMKIERRVASRVKEIEQEAE